MEEKAVNLNGLQVHYKIAGPPAGEAGSGPPILILHGWGSKSDRWVAVAELLSQNHFSVVVPDLPGFGKSGAPSFAWSVEDYCNFVDRFVQSIGLANFYLFGHSFGGGIAAVYASKFPSRVKKLVLFASAVFRRESARKTILKVVARVFRIFSFVPFYGLLRKAFYKFVVRKSDYPYAPGVMKETYKKVIGSDLSSYLSLIEAQTLIIWGDKDDVIPVSDAYLIHQRIKDSQLAIIPGGDHDIEQHMPEKLSEAIIKFLSSA
ncbi:MAG: alpha/beta hydrolase fold protein [Parcubacteria group bacterium Greene0714_21]|nr:MAG: alpha/beta hydrolase fold protein [Parcubacteria group bacterium Greene0416_39]TSC97648.1 MAG: alpha/beta hydrolase fold protein [Parcubacteria group bacterium Greene1014_47]TSD03878.1 MAG: alpha/beta hydrolase fold protein [Parcubacteria group bacterium Greene0714_21]